ncbi:MAG: response regulator, partial [Cyclobacteriaceae bacterium]
MGKWKNANLRTKVILGFAMVITAVILAGLISYNSYKDLLQSVTSPSSAEYKLKKLNQVLVDVSEAETYIRAYTITGKRDNLRPYLDFAKSIAEDIDSLKLIPPIDETQNIRIDSLRELLDEKVTALNKFITYKKTSANANFSARAIEEISTNTDSVKAITHTRTKTTTTIGALPKIASPETAQANEPKRKRRKRRAKNVDPILPVQLDPQIRTETQFITDTSYIQSDTVLGSITRILTNISDEEKRYQQLLQQKELDIIEGNSQIIYQIRSLIGQLEKEALANSIANANQAKFITNRSTFTISLIIIACMIAGILFIYMIFRDIKIGDYYNQQLIGAKNEAEELAKTKEAFLANMSHEIRTPLNAILGFSEQLKTTRLDDGQRSYLKALTSSSEHLLDTVNDILDFSKIEAGQMKIETVPLELNDIIEEVCHNLKIKAIEKNIGLECTSSEERQGLLGDPFRLRQILINLINNAIKFTDQGTVTVGLELVEEASGKILATITVKDTGIGISKEKISEIFEDFNQADISPTRRYEGTGLGLAICKKLVELQGGNIAASSKLGKGSIFTVALPFQKGSLPEEQHQLDPVFNQEALSEKNILVVEDDDFNVQLIQLILNKWGVNFDVARNGKEALTRIADRRYDLILTDIQMPELSGVELAQHIRNLDDAEKATTPIIAITANVMQNDLNQYLQLGIDDYLTKPFKEKELLAKLAKVFQIEQPMELLMEEEVASDSICNINSLEKFTAGDQGALIEILETFIDSNEVNTVNLNKLLQDQQWKALGELAHKMFSSYGHLG